MVVCPWLCIMCTQDGFAPGHWFKGRNSRSSEVTQIFVQNTVHHHWLLCVLRMKWTPLLAAGALPHSPDVREALINSCFSKIHTLSVELYFMPCLFFWLKPTNSHGTLPFCRRLGLTNKLKTAVLDFFLTAVPHLHLCFYSVASIISIEVSRSPFSKKVLLAHYNWFSVHGTSKQHIRVTEVSGMHICSESVPSEPWLSCNVLKLTAHANCPGGHLQIFGYTLMKAAGGDVLCAIKEALPRWSDRSHDRASEGYRNTQYCHLPMITFL